MATQLDLQQRAFTYQWIVDQPYEFDVAVCWHLPNSLRSRQNGWDDRWLENKLSRYLNCLDRRVLKSAHRRRKQKIPRFVVLENSASVGWHIHALMASKTTGLSTERLCQMVILSWLAELGCDADSDFKSHLVWAKPHDGGYARYMTKSISSTADDRGKVDLTNTSL